MATPKTILVEVKINGLPQQKELKSIDDLKNAIKALQKEKVQLDFTNPKDIERIKEIDASIAKVKGTINAQNAELREQTKVFQQSEKAANATVGSYNELSAVTSKLTILAKGLGDELTLPELDELKAQVGGAVKGFSDLSLEQANAGQAAKLLKTQINGNNEELRDFNRSISGANQLIGEYDRALLDVLQQTQTGGIGILTQRFDKLKDKESELVAETQRLVKELEQVDESSDEFKKLESQLNTTATELQAVQNEADKVNQSIAAIGDNSAFGKAKKSIGGFLSDLKAGFAFSIADSVAGQIQQVVSDTGEAIRTLQKLGAGVENVLGDSTDNVEATTAKAAAIIRQFDVDQKELLRSTNAITEAYAKQGLTADKSLNGVRDLFIQIGDISPDILDQIGEYAPLLEKAGFSADEFFALIKAQAEEGIPKDKLLDSLKELDLSLTEFTTTQQKALAPLGEAFVEDLAKRIDEGSLTVRDAFFEIQEQSKEMGLSISEQQGIIADVFKGAGEDAGGFAKVMTVVDKAINESDVSLTNYQKTQLRLSELNEKLALTQGELAKEVLGTTASYDEFGVRAKIVATEVLRDIALSFKSTQERFAAVSKQAQIFKDVLGTSSRAVEELDETVKKRRGLFDFLTNYWIGIINGATKAVQTINGFGGAIGELFNQVTSLTFSAEGIGDAFDRGFNKGIVSTEGAKSEVLDLNQTLEATKSQLSDLEQERQINVEIGADTTDLDKQIADKKAELESLQSFTKNTETKAINEEEKPFAKTQDAVNKLVETAAKIDFENGSLNDLNNKLQKAQSQLEKVTDATQRVQILADIKGYEAAIEKVKKENEVISKSLNVIELDLSDNLFDNLSLAREQLAELQKDRVIAIEAGIDPAHIDEAIAELERIQAALPTALDTIPLNFDATESSFSEAADKVAEQLSTAINSDKPQKALSELLEKFQEQLSEKEFEFFTQEQLKGIIEGLDIGLTDDVFSLDEKGLLEFQERIQEAFDLKGFGENSEEIFTALQELLLGVAEDAERAGRALQLEKSIQKIDATGEAIGSLSQVTQTLGKNFDSSSKAGKAFEKVSLALSAAEQVATAISAVKTAQKQAQAAAEASSAVAQSAGSIPFPGNLVAIASVIGALLAAFSSIKGAFSKGEKGLYLPTKGIEGGKLHSQGGNKYRSGIELERDEAVVDMINPHGQRVGQYVFSRKVTSDPVLKSFLQDIDFQATTKRGRMTQSKTPRLAEGGAIPIPNIIPQSDAGGGGITVINNTGTSVDDVQAMIDAQQEKVLIVNNVNDFQETKNTLEANQTAFNP